MTDLPDAREIAFERAVSEEHLLRAIRAEKALASAQRAVRAQAEARVAVEQERDDHYASGLTLADELNKAKALLRRWQDTPLIEDDPVANTALVQDIRAFLK
jgi:hypothetical protein